MTIRSGTSSAGSIFFSDATSGNAEFAGFVQYLHNNNSLSFGTDETTRMTINNSGAVGIGTTSPQTDLHITDTSAAPTIRLSSAANGLTELQFGDANDTVRGNIVYRNGTAGDALCFNGYNNTERMRIDSSGNVGIGTSSPDTMLHLESNGVSTIRLTDNDTTAENDQMIGKIEFETRDSNATGIGADILTEITDTTSSACALFLRTGTPSTLGTRLMVHSGGKLTATGVYNGITTGGSPVYVESDGDLLRFTSSSKYKTDIETLEDTRADNILNCRPVWYKSTCANDIKTEGGTKSDWGWYGFIAEEVATVDPRLVSWATKDSVETEGSANNKSVERDPSKYTAEGVRYDNFVPLLVNLLKRQKSQIEVLETKVAALEAA
jgi:hypothetical protein